MPSPQKTREIILQFLYSRHMANPDKEAMIQWIMRELKVSRKNVLYADEVAHKVQEHLHQIDELIARFSTSYDLERIQAVTLSVLRFALYEMQFAPTRLPPPIAIAEAIRLARKYSSPEAATFVNGVLDAIVRQSAPHHVADVEEEKDLEDDSPH